MAAGVGPGPVRRNGQTDLAPVVRDRGVKDLDRVHQNSERVSRWRLAVPRLVDVSNKRRPEGRGTHFL